MDNVDNDVDLELLKLQFDLWKKVVDVQMHFNDLCIRVRSFAVSLLGVLLGSSAFAYKFAGHLDIGGFSFHTSAIFIFISIVVWLSFYVMDRFWYHELLRGAVSHGRTLEEKLTEKIPVIGLAGSIRVSSHSSLSVNAATKLNIFYLVIALIQIVGLCVILFGSMKISV